MEDHNRPEVPDQGAELFKMLDAPAMSDVVEILGEMLEKAKAGDLRSVAIAFESRECGTGSSFALGDGDTAHLVCAMERLKLRLLD